MRAAFSKNAIENLTQLGREFLNGVSFNKIYDKRFDQTDMLLFWKDDSGNFLGCNRKNAILMGAQSPSLLIGRNDFELFNKDDSLQYYRDDQEVIRSFKPKLNISESINSKENQTFLMTSKFPICSTNGKKFGLLGIAVDISEYKILENCILKLDHGKNQSANFENHSSFDNTIVSIKKLVDNLSQVENKGKFTFFYQGNKFVLSFRQMQCITLTLQGKTSKQIAQYLALSPKTVESHLAVVKVKFNCENKSKIIEILLSSRIE